MDDIGGWWNTWLRYFQTHWQEHALPAVIQLLVTLTAVFTGIFVAMFGGMASALVGSTMKQRGIEGDWILALLIPVIWMFVAAVVVLAVMPLSVGYARASLRSVRGTPIQLGDLLWGYRRLGSVILLRGLVTTAAGVGTLFCIVPGIVIGWMFAYASFCLGEREQGAIDAMGASWRLARGHFASLVVWELVVVGVSLVAAFIPFVGNLLVIPISVTMRAVVYDLTTRREGLPAT